MGPIAHGVVAAGAMIVEVFMDPAMLKHGVVVTACGVVLSYALGETYKKWKPKKNRRKGRPKKATKLLLASA